jgi:outer membrane protein TolC
MRGARGAAGVIAGLVLSGGAPAAAPPELRIGRASEIDTQALRSAIEGTRGDPGAGASGGAPVRSIGLEEAIRLALEHNLRLQIAALDRDIAEREVPARRAFFHPTPGMSFLASDARLQDPLEIADDGTLVKQSGSRSDRSQLARVFVRQELPTGAQLTLGLDALRESGDEFGGGDALEGGAQVELRQPLLRGGRVYVATAPIRDAEYTLGILEAQLRAQILQVTAEAKQAYYDTILAERLIEVSEQAIERAHELIAASHALFRAGRASQRDIVSAEIQLSDHLSDLASRRASLDLAQLALRDVLGLGIGEYLKPADATIRFEPVELRLGAWIEHALARRPEIQEILYRLERSALLVRVAGNAVLPKLDVVGVFRRNDSDTSARRVWGFGSQRWIAALEFEVPFGNVAARERLRAAALDYARIERELESQRRLIELEVRAEELSLRENLEELRAQTDKVEQARQKLEIAQVRYQRGIADNFDVTDAQEDLVDAESDLLAAVVGYTNGRARLEARIAGPL